MEPPDRTTTIQRNPIDRQCKISKGAETSRSALNNEHQPGCSRSPLQLIAFVICGSILAALISTECDMMLVGDLVEPYWPMNKGKSSADTFRPSSDVIVPLGQELWAQETMDSTLEHIEDAIAKAPCHRVSTHRAYVFGLPSPVDSKPVQLKAGQAHKLTIVSYDVDGKSRCAGGDYYEIDLSSDTWKSRPPVVDLANGSYHFILQVDPRFIGLFMLKITLAFGNFQGLEWSTSFGTSPFYRGQEMFKMEIEFKLANSDAWRPGGRGRAPYHSILNRCNASKGHFNFQRWAGRWTRNIDSKEACSIDANGRFGCLDLDTECERPWCQGPVGRLESNGWVYSAHCSFKIFTEDEAWKCLNGKWLLFWGDSNHQDTIRNLLSFVLGFTMFNSWIPRRFDQVYTRPPPLDSQQSLRITNVFNGHIVENSDGLGLWSLSNDVFRSQTERFFNTDQQVPDVVILNSGLHDAIYWKTALDYVNVGVDQAMKFWQRLLDRFEPKDQPLMIFRHTVTTAGTDQTSIFNPSKLELFSRILGQRFANLNMTNFRIVDDFDITFPWHYDLRCSDGMHYGRSPANTTWKDGIPGHQYFVDLMLVHIHLNVICQS